MTGGRLLWVREDVALVVMGVQDQPGRAPTQDELLGELARHGVLVIGRPMSRESLSVLPASTWTRCAPNELIDALVDWSDAVDAYKVNDSHIDRIRAAVLAEAEAAAAAGRELEDAVAMDRQGQELNACGACEAPFGCELGRCVAGRESERTWSGP